MSAYKSGVKAFDDAANASEGVRQAAVQAPGATAASIRAAEISHYKTVRSAAIANGISPWQFNAALQKLQGTAGA
jgi:hypothetical protein